MCGVTVSENSASIVALRITMPGDILFESTNSAFTPFLAGKKLIPKAKMARFKKIFTALLAYKKIAVNPEILQAKYIKTDYTFYLKTRFSRRDLTNLVKYTEDIIHAKLQIDDSKVVQMNLNKKQTENKSEYLIFTLKPVTAP